MRKGLEEERKNTKGDREERIRRRDETEEKDHAVYRTNSQRLCPSVCPFVRLCRVKRLNSEETENWSTPHEKECRK